MSQILLYLLKRATLASHSAHSSMACNNYTLATQTTYFLPTPQRRLLQSTAQEIGYLGLPPAAHLQTHLCHLYLHIHKMGGKHDITTLQWGWCKSHQGTTREEKGLEMGGIEGVQEDWTQLKGWRGRERGKDRANRARTQ